MRTGAATPQVVDLGAGHPETNLVRSAEDRKSRRSAVVLELLRSCRLFHFHDTSENSAIRRPSYIEANRFLYPDAGNLAAMLYLYKKKYPAAYRRITATVRQMVPDFADFVLEPSPLNEQQIFLNWTHKGRDYEFGPHQLSDGSLRFIALATLLLQPEEKRPLLIALDEPELGLHPAALEILAGMASAAALHCQVIFATQSSVFLDHFEPEDVVVVNSRSGTSEFTGCRPRSSPHGARSTPSARSGRRTWSEEGLTDEAALPDRRGADRGGLRRERLAGPPGELQRVPASAAIHRPASPPARAHPGRRIVAALSAMPCPTCSPG